jgi:hypothetical protein
MFWNMAMKKIVPRQHQLKSLNASQMIKGQHQLQNADKWRVAKTDAKHPTTEHNVDVYIVTVGFEVNKPAAFTCQTASLIDRAIGVGKEYCTQNLDVDYGHAFFYVTKNSKITAFFSFGPDGAGKMGVAALRRKGTSDYLVTEATKLFRLLITKGSYDLILQETAKIREEIRTGKQKYNASVNDTCAETARDILKKGITNLPKGTSGVSKSGITVVDAINPYMWYRNFKKAGYAEYSLKHIPLYFSYVDPRDGSQIRGWASYANEDDPLIRWGGLK